MYLLYVRICFKRINLFGQNKLRGMKNVNVKSEWVAPYPLYTDIYYKL